MSGTEKDDFIYVWAQAEPAFNFSHWSGDILGVEYFKTILMNSDKNATAEFNYVYTPTPTSTPTPTPTSPPSSAYMVRVSSGSGGTNPAITNVGNFLAYYGNNGTVMRYQRGVGTPQAVVAGIDGVGVVGISDDGRHIAYTAPGPNFTDLFLYDHTTGTSQNLTNHPASSTVLGYTIRDIKVKVTGISVLVAYTTTFSSYPPFITEHHIWLYDSAQGTASEINPAIGSGPRFLRDISDDGEKLLVRSNDSLYVVNRSSQIIDTITPPVAVDVVGGAGFSADGRYVAYDIYEQICTPFCSYNRYIYWYDRVTAVTEEIHTYWPELNTPDIPVQVSNNGRYIFYGYSSNIYRYDRVSDAAWQVTLTLNGSNPNGPFYNLDSSGDGRFVTFSSAASNLVTGDTSTEDVFLADMDLWSQPPTPGTPTPTATPGSPTPTNTPVPTQTPTPTATSPASSGLIYVSSTTNGSVGGVSFADEDILSFNVGTGAWAMVLDTSTKGITVDLNAFDIQSDGTILMSFDTAASISGLGTVDDSDIVRYTPATGTFSLYFDGSDVGLSTDAEDIDALGFAPDGRLLISTTGNPSVTGVSGNDEDLLAFTATSMGSTTAGTWSLYFDGSDVGLNNTSTEDVNGLWVDSTSENIYLTTVGAFSVTGVSGDGADIIICVPGSLGSTTTCTYSMYWDGSLNGFAGKVVDGLDIVP